MPQVLPILRKNVFVARLPRYLCTYTSNMSRITKDRVVCRWRIIRNASPVHNLSRQCRFYYHPRQVLIYDHLFGPGLKCGGRYRAAINRHKAALTTALDAIKSREGVESNIDLLSENVRLAGTYIIFGLCHA